MIEHVACESTVRHRGHPLAVPQRLEDGAPRVGRNRASRLWMMTDRASEQSRATTNCISQCVERGNKRGRKWRSVARGVVSSEAAPSLPACRCCFRTAILFGVNHTHSRTHPLPSKQEDDDCTRLRTHGQQQGRKPGKGSTSNPTVGERPWRANAPLCAAPSR
jgi:hypothetical protein